MLSSIRGIRNYFDCVIYMRKQTIQKHEHQIMHLYIAFNDYAYVVSMPPPSPTEQNTIDWENATICRI